MVQFEAYEAERQRQTPGLGAPDTATTSRPLTEPEKQREESDDDEEPEPSLFDILDDDAEDDPEDEASDDHQEWGSRGFARQGPGPRACQVLPGRGSVTVGNNQFGSSDSGSKLDRTGSMSQQFLAIKY